MTAEPDRLAAEMDQLLKLGVDHGLHEAVAWVEGRFSRRRTRRFRGELLQQILAEAFDEQGQVREP